LHSPDEIEYLIAESREGGLFRPDEHERLRKALHLGVLQVEEIMIPRVRVVSLDIDTPFPEVVRRVSESPFTRIPVYQNSLDHVIGFVHVQDVIRNSLEGADAQLRNLVRPTLVVSVGMTAERVLGRLREARQHLAVVIDEYGGTAGLVSVGDILDEIFGGIVNEFGGEEPSPERLPDGRVRLPGSLRLDEAADWVGVHWQSDAYTVAGLVAEALGRVPRAGEHTEIGGVSVEVERVQSHIVQTVLVVPVVLAEEADHDLE
jgi:CBS domain containing-hemolysin-like protein